MQRSGPAWDRAERDKKREVSTKQVQREMTAKEPQDPAVGSTDSDLECWGGGGLRGAPRRAQAFHRRGRPQTQLPKLSDSPSDKKGWH